MSWHLTWANAWFGSLAASVGQTFVFGPVGAGAGTPWRLVGTLGARGAVGEVLRTFARTTGRYLNPLSRRAISRAALILVQNPETERWLPADRRRAALLFPQVVLPDGVQGTSAHGAWDSRTILFAGRLLAWKGGSLVLRTLVRLPDHRLIICGGGPDEARLRALADRSGSPLALSSAGGSSDGADSRRCATRHRSSSFRGSTTKVDGSSSRHEQTVCRWSAWIAEVRSCLAASAWKPVGRVIPSVGLRKPSAGRVRTTEAGRDPDPQPHPETRQEILEQRTTIPVIDRPSDR